MEQVKKSLKWQKFVPWAIIAVMLIGGYFYLKANLVIVDKQDYEGLKSKVEMQFSMPQKHR